MATQATSTVEGRLKAIRSELGLTQADFASGAGLSYSLIIGIEQGIRKLTLNTSKKICAAYSVNEEWLRNGYGSMFGDDKQAAFDQFARAFNLTVDQQNHIAEFIHFPIEIKPAEVQSPIKRRAARILDAVNHGAIGRVSTI